MSHNECVPSEIEYPIHPQVQHLMDLPKHEQRSDEWYALRKQKLTASDLATALGMNPYQSRHDLVYKKSGGAESFFGNAATKHGQKYEDKAIEIYSKQYGVKSYDFGLIPHPSIDFLAGSPDGITNTGILLEVKCPLKRVIIPGVIPHYYIPQMLLCMECTDLNECHFIQYKPPSKGEPEIFDVTVLKRDSEWFQRYLPVMDLFWKEVLYYRSIGIEHHPLTMKKERDAKDKEAKKKLKEKQEKEKITYMFKEELE